MENINEIEEAVPQKKWQFGKTFWLALWALIGLGLSIKLTIIYFMMNFVPDATPSFCAINETIDCDAVAKTGVRAAVPFIFRCVFDAVGVIKPGNTPP